MVTTPEQSDRRPRRARGPLALVLDVFSSVKLGMVTLTVLFVYMTIGSAGVIVPSLSDRGLDFYHLMVRQLPAFEMTEFEWFHTKTFIVLCALLTVNLAVTTIRKIPFNLIKLGPWIIHTGIIVMTVSSAWYFARKFEGDTFIIRRNLDVEVDGRSVTVPVLAGNRAEVETDEGVWSFEISSIDPRWPVLSEGYEDVVAYAVSVLVTPPDGEMFMRQVLDGLPELTEDLVASNDPSSIRPFQRVATIEELQTAGDERARTLLLPESALAIGLSPYEQRTFAMKDTTAIYLRPVGAEAWSIVGTAEKLPRYNDYVSNAASVWPSPEVAEAIERPLDVPLELRDSETGVPIEGASARVTGFLRYAVMEERFERDVSGAGPLNPVLELTISRADGRVTAHPLVANDPARRATAAGLVAFAWAESPKVYDAIRAQPAEQRTPITFVAGPGVPEHFDGLVMLWEADQSRLIERDVRVGQVLDLGDGFALVPERLMERAFAVSMPRIVPPVQRDRDADRARLYSMIELTFAEDGGEPRSAWLHYHKYAFPNEGHADIALSVWRPSALRLAGGIELEAMYSRETRPLPGAVVLDDFVLSTHVGGFTGTANSIRDWTSRVSFAEGSDGWNTAEGEGIVSISTNNPTNRSGLWFFQAFWDAPRQGSNGLNFTGLGIANREGVSAMLAGSTISVLGLIYAFYVKPIVQRRRLNAALARTEATAVARSAAPRGATRSESVIEATEREEVAV